MCVCVHVCVYIYIHTHTLLYFYFCSCVLGFCSRIGPFLQFPSGFLLKPEALKTKLNTLIFKPYKLSP